MANMIKMANKMKDNKMDVNKINSKHETKNKKNNEMMKNKHMHNTREQARITTTTIRSKNMNNEENKNNKHTSNAKK